MEDSVTESEIKREIERKQGDREGEDVPSNKRDEEEIMEGGFINQFISNLVSPSSSPRSRETYVGGKMEEAEVEETQSGVGIINKISNFFHQENEDGEKEKEIDKMKVEEEGEEKKVKGMEELDNGDSGGGVINNLISNFFYHSEGEEREMKRGKRGEEVSEDLKKEEEDEKELNNGGGGGGGGRINNLISSFFHQNEGDGEGEGEGGGGEEEKGTNTDQELTNGKGDVAKEQESKMEVESANGGIINNLVSNLAASLPDSTVPANDEASILIHSIIHD